MNASSFSAECMNSYSTFPPSVSEMALTLSKMKVVEDNEDDDVKIVTPTAPKKKTTAKKVTKKIMKKENEGEIEEDKKHWKDADVEVMIALRGEMESEFLKNAKKQCVDVWLKLHARMVAVILGLNRTVEACEKKLNVLYKQYRLDKMANGVSGLDRHECKFYDAFDLWWHQIGTVIKHVTASANGSTCIEESTKEPEKEQISELTPTSSVKSGKKNFQEQNYGLFTQMVENSSVMVKNFEKPMLYWRR